MKQEEITPHIPPVLLQTYFISDFSFSTIFGLTQPNTLLSIEDINCGVSVLHNEDETDLWQVILNLSIKEPVPENFPYVWSLKINGLFKTHRQPKKEGAFGELVPLMYNIGSSLLYTSAREYLRSVTSVSPCGPVFLPTMAFYPSNVDQNALAENKTKKTQ